MHKHSSSISTATAMRTSIDSRDRAAFQRERATNGDAAAAPNGAEPTSRAPHHHDDHRIEKFPEFDSDYGGLGAGGTGGGIISSKSNAGSRSSGPRRLSHQLGYGGNSHGTTILNGHGNSTAAPSPSAQHATSSTDSRWHPRRDSRVRWAPQQDHHFSSPPPSSTAGRGHARQQSLVNAISRMRAGSMRENAQEIAGALRAPVSYKLVVLCLIWYWSSALTNTSSKAILMAFDKPATLTIVQFAFVSSYCVLFSWLASTFPRIRAAMPALNHPLRAPSREVIMTTLPLAGFQIGGHLLSSTATSKIPVSLVHTIKGLSPLFTVLAYRFIYDIRYPRATYLSLIPLTVGVMLACSGKHGFAGQFMGILHALLATIIFVTQNIVSKKLFNEAAEAEEQGLGARSRKLDKLNLLFYSSSLALIITFPLWFWTDGISLLGDFLWDGSIDLAVTPTSFDHGRLTVEFVFNGTFHFGQNLLAFILLSMVSPVTYSVASLMKRVFVVVVAILWFRNPTTQLQALGIGLTFLGLYLYDHSNERNKADQRARSMTELRAGGADSHRPILPLAALDVKATALPSAGSYASSHHNHRQAGPQPLFESPVSTGQPSTAAMAAALSPSSSSSFPYSTGGSSGGYGLPAPDDHKKSDDFGRGRAANGSMPGWLPPGTRQEDTWRLGDGQQQVSSAA